MADFLYSFSKQTNNNSNLNGLYNNKFCDPNGLSILFNDNTITNLLIGDNRLIILGYVNCIGMSINEYFNNILLDFNEDKITDIKKTLHGQYILLLLVKNKLYILADFLQSRPIYYSFENKIICSRYSEICQLTSDNSFNDYKIFEYLAMKHIVYPSFLSNTTLNDGIYRLRAYEYLKINLDNGQIEVCDLKFEINNKKNYSLDNISNITESKLKSLIYHPDFKDKKIGLTLTGGFDSRLISFIAKEYYSNSYFRVAVNKGSASKDYSIAKRISRISNKELMVFENDPNIHQIFFYKITDGFSPKENSIITPLVIENVFDLGIGGVFGTELYNTINFNSVEDFIKCSVDNIKNKFINADINITKLRKEIINEFEQLKLHYYFVEENEKDLIRLFILNSVASFNTTILSAYNIKGNNYEPYGTFPIIELGFQIPDKFAKICKYGNKFMVQKSIMYRLNKRVSIIQSTRYAPLSPLNVFSLFSYLVGHNNLIKDVKKGVFDEIKNPKEIIINDWKYLSDDWCEGFIDKYVYKK